MERGFVRQIKVGDECILKIQEFVSDLIRGIEVSAAK